MPPANSSPESDDDSAVAMDRPPQQRGQLVLLAVAVVLSMSPWFSTAAVMPQLRKLWRLDSNAASWLTISVQLGFVFGALLSSVLNLADRVRPRRLILVGSVSAAVANMGVVQGGGYGPALISRFVTGAALAFVYPPAVKAVSGWYRTGRGLAIGVTIGALTTGSALPHLVNAVGRPSWKVTLAVVSILTVAGGVLAERTTTDGPFLGASVAFDPTLLRTLLRNRKFRLACVGYFGHMWELYAMWAWIGVFYADTKVAGPGRTASILTFVTIAAGAGGSVVAGRFSDRTSRPRAAATALIISGTLATFTGFTTRMPLAVTAILAIAWGASVVADSAQFSAIVTEVTDQHQVGTALTVQLAAGFVLTVFTIFLVPVVRDAASWGWAFAMLTPGPVVGVWAMRQLERASR